MQFHASASAIPVPRLLLTPASFVFGCVASAAWPPVACWILAIAAYGLLFRLLGATTNALQAGICGFSFGIGLHLCGDAWVFQALRAHGGLGLISASLSTAFYLAYLATFTAIPCALHAHLIRGASRAPLSALATCLLFAALLALGEWARTLLFNGVTSLSLGYALIDTWLSGYGPVIGMYGMSGAGYFIAAGLSSILEKPYTGGWRPHLGIGILVILVVANGGSLARVRWTQPHGRALTYRLIQSQLQQSVKFDPHLRPQHAQNLARTIQNAPANLIITPETAFPVSLNELPADLVPRLREFSQNTGSNLFLGLVTTASNADGYNSLLHIDPLRSDAFARYDKARLMPFGEYAPAGFTWFTRLLDLPLKDMRAGADGQRPFAIAHAEGTVRIGALICHEESSAVDARKRARDANLLIDVSNLSWFDGSSAIPQALQMARMRALETGKPLLRVANTGITAEIDASGHVPRQLPLEEDGVLAGTVRGTDGVTPFGTWGHALVLGAASVIVACAAAMRALRRRRWTGWFGEDR